MRKVAVIGVGETNFSGAQKKTNTELFAEAAMDAITESNLKPADIQALFLGNALGGFAEGQGMVQAFAAESIGADNIPANRYEGACASASIAITDAFRWVASGFCDVVLAGGVERAATMGTPLATRTFAMFSDSHYEYPSGVTFPAVYGLLAHLYSKRYGIPMPRLKEQMAAVSVQSYHYGRSNPKARFRRTVTADMVLKSPMVCSPLQLHDCCSFADGAAAIVIASEEKAKALTGRPVYITGVGQASAGLLANQYEHLPRIRSRELAAGQAYRMAGITPAEVDVCELYDCFSIASLIAAEGLGFFDFGTAGAAWEQGRADIGGRVAVNLSGGLNAKGDPIGATGAGQVYEIVKQLRGEVSPEGLAAGAKTGMTDTVGGAGGTACTMIFQRGW
ncbi:beta-ketoacyl synthase N-terminal-like domain-containing protein [Chloroflexota bacterium]